MLRAPSFMTLQLSRAKVTYGVEQTEHFSVVVSPKYSTTTPTGTVEVKKSTTILCYITLSSGKGSCTTLRSRLHAGRYSIYATYPRNLNFVGSTAAAVLGHRLAPVLRHDADGGRHHKRLGLPYKALLGQGHLHVEERHFHHRHATPSGHLLGQLELPRLVLVKEGPHGRQMTDDSDQGGNH